MQAFIVAWTVVAIAALLFRKEAIWMEPDLYRRRGQLLLCVPGMALSFLLALVIQIAWTIITAIRVTVASITATWLGKDVYEAINKIYKTESESRG